MSGCGKLRNPIQKYLIEDVMNTELKKLIHALRNALVMASDTHSYVCFNMPRWSELNSFPYGCCDLASNFLAKYLREHGYESKVIFFKCNEKVNKYINAHVILQVGEYYVDITRSQFDDSNARIAIEDKYGPLAGIIRNVKKEGHHSYQEREINLDTGTSQGIHLYHYVRDMADKLISC